MTNLIPIIFWTSIGAIALAFIIALIRLRVPRERGPWLVCRVAADGSGGVEFRALVGPLEWVSNPMMAYPWSSQTAAELTADRHLADVVPLSRYVGKGR